MTFIALIRAYLTTLVASFVARIPVSIDRTVGKLEATAARLERAADQQRARARAEIDAGLSAFARAGEANSAAARATRVAGNMRELIA